MTSFELINCLRERFPDYRFFEDIDFNRNFVEIHIRYFDESIDLTKFIFERIKYFHRPAECFEQIVEWLDNYISIKRLSQTVCCENRLELRAMKPMTCEKCGAPLKGCECEYCGTKYYIPDNDTIAHMKQELNQARFDVANGYILSSGAINAATARDMYMAKMSSCFSNIKYE